ncbi:ATP-binding protein [Arthrobacter sp. 08Y14]|uniref:ATP-binding protein n=1 Tax=Arthrobacter sp. 08Y14 TaxID=2058885 RepID=UPI0015E2901D|nr:ATP-binding protein [Arthrobacter sp. 08Y14]
MTRPSLWMKQRKPCCPGREAPHPLLVHGRVAPAIGSRALLLQVAINLLHNAFSHHLPDGGTVRVCAELHPGSVELVVENPGKNYRPNWSRRMPNRSSAARNACSDQAGVGLVLSIVRSIVQVHDGALTITARR